MTLMVQGQCFGRRCLYPSGGAHGLSHSNQICDDVGVLQLVLMLHRSGEVNGNGRDRALRVAGGGLPRAAKYCAVAATNNKVLGLSGT